MPVSNIDKERLSEINKSVIQAGASGMLKGLLVGLVTGYFFDYRYNHGHNKRFFSTPYKTWYLVSWSIVGLSFAAEVARSKIIRDLAKEENIRREQYFADEMSGGRT